MSEQIVPLRAPRSDLAQLVSDLKAVVYQHEGRISLTEAIGALEIAKLEVFAAQTSEAT